MCVCIHVHVCVYNQCCMVLYIQYMAIGSSGNWFYWTVSDLYARFSHGVSCTYHFCDVVDYLPMIDRLKSVVKSAGKKVKITVAIL